MGCCDQPRFAVCFLFIPHLRHVVETNVLNLCLIVQVLPYEMFFCCDNVYCGFSFLVSSSLVCLLIIISLNAFNVALMPPEG